MLCALQCLVGPAGVRLVIWSQIIVAMRQREDGSCGMLHSSGQFWFFENLWLGSHSLHVFLWLALPCGMVT